LVARVFQQIYLEAYNETVESMYTKKVSLSNGETVCFCLADVGQADTEVGMSNTAKYINRASGFLLCCTAEDINSWLYVGELFQEIKSLRSKDVPVVVALLKSDLSGPVTFDAIQTKCAEWNVPCFETSACLNMQCEQPFSKLLELVLVRCHPIANASVVFDNTTSRGSHNETESEEIQFIAQDIVNIIESPPRSQPSPITQSEEIQMGDIVQNISGRTLRTSLSTSYIPTGDNPRSLLNRKQFGMTTINLRELIEGSPTEISVVEIPATSDYQKTQI